MSDKQPQDLQRYYNEHYDGCPLSTYKPPQGVGAKATATAQRIIDYLEDDARLETVAGDVIAIARIVEAGSSQVEQSIQIETDSGNEEKGAVAASTAIPKDSSLTNEQRFLEHFIVKIEPHYERKHGHPVKAESGAWELLAFVEHALTATQDGGTAAGLPTTVPENCQASPPGSFEVARVLALREEIDPDAPDAIVLPAESSPERQGAPCGCSETRSCWEHQGDGKELFSPDRATPAAAIAEGEREFDHFSIVPFKAICGADRSGQTTTQTPERTKCPICWQYWSEWYASYRAYRTPLPQPDQGETK